MSCPCVLSKHGRCQPRYAAIRRDFPCTAFAGLSDGIRSELVSYAQAKARRHRSARNHARRGARFRTLGPLTPTVALTQHEDLVVDRLNLLLGKESRDLGATVTADILHASPETRVVEHLVDFKDAWDFERVYGTLLDFAKSYAFNPDAEEYLVHITTGTHIAPNLPLLADGVRVTSPARLLADARGRDATPSAKEADLGDMRPGRDVDELVLGVRIEGVALREVEERAVHALEVRGILEVDQVLDHPRLGWKHGGCPAVTVTPRSRLSLPRRKIEPVDDQVVVLGESDSRTPAVPTCGTAPRVERGSEQTDDDELSLGHSLLAHFLYHGIAQRRRCAGKSRRIAAYSGWHLPCLDRGMNTALKTHVTIDTSREPRSRPGPLASPSRPKPRPSWTRRRPPLHPQWVAVMPDVHAGIGATVGSVVATKGAIIPAAVGVDIGCGMMAVKTTLTATDLPDNLRALRTTIEAAVPHGRTDNGGPNDRGAWSDLPAGVGAAWAELEPGYQELSAKFPKLGAVRP